MRQTARMQLLTPTRLGDLDLRTRVVMAPMTRSRAGAADEPTDLVVEYYRQRAGAGMIISEGIYPSADGKGYVRTPGLVTDAQTAGWRRVTDAVHEAGGTIVAQLMHCGRIAHADNKDPGARTVAPSAIRADGAMYTDTVGMAPFDEPVELTTDEVVATIDDYRHAAANAMAAGFDGVELHGTSGYLPAQFLSTGTNHRTDRYGGSVENRIRFVVETLEALTAEIGAARVGLRVCPGNPFNDLHDDDPVETFTALFDAIESKGLAYLHVIRMDAGVDNLALARSHSSAPLIVNDSYDVAEAEEVVAAGAAAAVSFARAYISNPDLVERIRQGVDLTAFDRKALYTVGPEGYTDYPAAT